MGQTTFSGPLKVGTKKDGPQANVGTPILLQEYSFDFNSSGDITTTIVLPADAYIVDIWVDVTTAWDSATSATLTVGRQGDTDAFASGLNLKTVGRGVPTFDATQIVNIQNVGTSDVPIVINVTNVGAPTTGVAYLEVSYIQF